MLTAVSIALVGASLIAVQEQPARLDGTALAQTFNDASLRGCYPDGSQWHELTRADGSLFDQTVTPQREIGSWWVADDEVCYRYGAPNSRVRGTCWTVYRDDRHLYFITSYGSLGAMTNCDDDPIV